MTQVPAVSEPRYEQISPSPPLPPGTVPLTPDDPALIGEYRLVARFASGEPGTCYLGCDPAGGHVVVKLGRPRPAGGNRARRNYVEAAAARMPAPYAARVLGRGLHDGTAYLAREYVAGLTLAELVAEDGRLDPVTLHSVAVAAAAAIAAVHDAGEAHGNLKPSNVVITLAGARLLDHGLARRSGEPKPSADVDVLEWARLVTFAGTGRETAATAQTARRELDGRLGAVVERALRPDPARRPSARAVLLTLVCPSGGGRGGASATTDTAERSRESDRTGGSDAAGTGGTGTRWRLLRPRNGGS